MRVVRSYVLEFCLLVVLLVLLMLTPAKALMSEEGFNFTDLAADCDGISGWCIPFPFVEAW